MEKVLIFGAGNTGKRELDNLHYGEEAIGFLDNDSNKWGKSFCGLPVYQPAKSVLSQIIYDEIIIASVQAKNEISKQLRDLGVVDNKIKFHTSDHNVMPMFLKNLKELFDSQGINGAMAEVGVFQGETAAAINLVFPDRLLYLFDTFEGFPEPDANLDRQRGYSEALPKQFSDTSEALVLSKMTQLQNVIIKKGYFPGSAVGVNENFCFVRIDLDLYQPTKKALDFFHDKMVPGGVVIVHDYFGGAYKGIKKIVDDYINNHSSLSLVPIADRFSIAIVGY